MQIPKLGIFLVRCSGLLFFQRCQALQCCAQNCKPPTSRGELASATRRGCRFPGTCPLVLLRGALLRSGSRSAGSRRGVCGSLCGPKASRARPSLPPHCRLLVPLNAWVESCGSGRGNAGCLPGTAVQWRKNCLCRTCRWSLLLFCAGGKEKSHPAGWRVQLLATDLLELVLLLRLGPAVRSHQGRGRGIPQIRIAGGSRGKVCSRRAGGALEGSGWWLPVPVSWANF